jgi:tRNA pseudouridine32 synthase/23S rRNA pseudouridine746 synthase
LILFARTYAAQRYFHRLFRERLVTKEYLALVDGQLAADAGEINLPITCDWPNRPKQKICFAQGKHSITRFRRLQQNQNQSLVLLSPITGRSHQLRIHMSMIGHPISGCKLYGNGEPDARLMLHAYRLSLQHPRTGKTISFSCYPEFLSSVQGHLLD